jgi:hypothetical protein
MLLDLAISRSRGSILLDDRTKELVRGCLEAAKQKLGQLAEPYGAANGDVHKEGTTMWSKLFGGGDGLPREKVDAVVRVTDRYLAEERPSSAGFRARNKPSTLETSLPKSAGR